MFKSGTTVIWSDTAPETGKFVIHSGIVQYSNKDSTRLVGEEFPRYTAFLYPDIPEAHELINKQYQLALKHKQEDDAMMKEVYEFNNELVRKGLK
jgi:hypothetical protein